METEPTLHPKLWSASSKRLRLGWKQSTRIKHQKTILNNAPAHNTTTVSLPQYLLPTETAIAANFPLMSSNAPGDAVSTKKCRGQRGLTTHRHDQGTRNPSSVCLRFAPAATFSRSASRRGEGQCKWRPARMLVSTGLTERRSCR